MNHFKEMIESRNIVINHIQALRQSILTFARDQESDEEEINDIQSNMSIGELLDLVKYYEAIRKVKE